MSHPHFSKYADPSVSGPVVGVFGAMVSNEWLISTLAVCIGLLFGAMWRAGSLIGEGKTWPLIRSDLLVSLMIGGANAVLALAIVEWLEIGPLFSMAIGVLVGATGLHALPAIRDSLVESAKAKLLSQGVAMIQPNDAEMEHKLDALSEKAKEGKHDEAPEGL